MYIGLLHVKCRLLLLGCNGTGILWTDFRNIPNINFHDNPSRHVPRGRADKRTDRQAWRSWYSLFAILQTRYKLFTLVEYSWVRSTYRSTRNGALPLHTVIPCYQLIRRFNYIGPQNLCFGEARPCQMASHTASHCLHGVIRRTALLSSDLILTEHMMNAVHVTVQLVTSVFVIQTPIRFNKCSNVSKCNALGLYRHSQWRCHNCRCGKRAV